MANLVTSEKILPLIEPVLDNSNIIKIKDTSKILEYRIESDNRASDRVNVENILTNNRISFGELTRNVGSFGGSEIVTFDMKTVRIIYKLKDNRGSGGGADDTRRNESAQALYAAIAFGLKRKITIQDINGVNVKKFSNKFVIDENVNNILDELPDEWIESSLLGANKLYEKFKKGKYVFHRGSKQVDLINDIFSRVKKLEKFRMDINKWNPSDIWMISEGFDFSQLSKERTILGLNQVIQDKLEDESLIGISLKRMVGSASISTKNVFKDMKTTRTYAGYEYSKKSIDGYILLSGGTKIQYRSFGAGTGLTGFQGEVKGANANQGKISLGPTNMILRNHGVSQVPTNAADRVRKEPLVVFNDISIGLKKYAKMSSSEITKLAVNEKIVTPKFLYSKLQVTQLITILESLKPNLRNQVVEDLYLYASSQSKYSSAYYKLE
tara:strand:- start:3410 stop:4729 length:1320 start_codon:yes stop_codon:yes gene_type:complete